MKKILSILSALILLSLTTFAQNIKGVVKDADGKTLSNASISLLNAKDSSVVKIAVTNTAGQYQFQNIKEGKYLTNTTFIGYAASYSPVFEVAGSGDVNLTAVSLSKANNDLKDVVVTARKPIVEVKADKTILNVENTINATGSDALELLRKSPGVVVDKDENISLAGKNGVQVYIDGKPSPLTGSDLANYLKTLQSSQIESIELITNPSAKYEAAGNAGIINIRLKKNKSFGTNGSVNAGYNIGIYPKYNGGISLNHRNKKVNLFGNYNYNDNRNEGFMNLYRIQLDTVFDQHSKMRFDNKSHNFKAGMDYFINNRNTVGVMVNGNLGDIDVSNKSNTIISYKPTGDVNKILKADNASAMKRNNLNANLNYHFADTSGHELNVDADYGYYDLKSDQFQPNYYYDPSGTVLQNQYIYNMIAPTKIDIYSVKADYEQNFLKGRLGYGAKFSYVKSVNNFERYNVYSDDKFLDTLRSNDFNYKENVNAAYINYNRQFKNGIMIQAGLRAENTNSKGLSNGYNWNGGYQPYDSSFKRNYTDLFPSAAITFNKNPKNQWSLAYSRRIDRPAYQDLNPFEFKLDEYTYQKGNTQLRPQYTNSISLTNTLWYRLTTKLTYSHVNDVFSQIIDTADKSKAFITKKNLADQDLVSLNISMPFQYKWYSVFANVNSYYSHYKANFGAGRNIDLDVFAVNVYAQQTFKVAKATTIEVSGFYTSPTIWQGTFKSGALWSVDGGIQQTFFKGKATAKASVTDIFQTLRWTGKSDFAGQYLKVKGGNESRQLRLSVTYRFGSNQVKAARQRKTGAEDESKRVGTQGGGLN
ncbi:outer membrane beta-barrel protein [Parafilimonas sp.]|uniref:outer membrane beta-barrel protein n=1 Tax=Parafilimonas sp. TaxID=1969739 RepID=UPI003F7F4EDD